MPFHITKNFGDVKVHFKNRLGVTQKSWNFHHTFLLRAVLHCKSLKNSRLIQTTRVSNFTKARIKQIGWERQFRSWRRRSNHTLIISQSTPCLTFLLGLRICMQVYFVTMISIPHFLLFLYIYYAHLELHSQYFASSKFYHLFDLPLSS